MGRRGLEQAQVVSRPIGARPPPPSSRLSPTPRRLQVLLVSLAVAVFVQAQTNALRGSLPSFRACNSVLPGAVYNATIQVSDVSAAAIGDTSTRVASWPAAVAAPTTARMRVHEMAWCVRCDVQMDGTLAAGGAGVPPRWTTTITSPDPLCPANGPGGASVRVAYQTLSGLAQPVTSFNASNPCLRECITAGDVCALPVTPLPPYSRAANLSFDSTLFLRCACQRLLESELATKSVADVSTTFPRFQGGVCADLFPAYTSYTAFLLGGSIIVVVINVLLRSLLAVIATWEGHPSLEDLYLSVSFKVFASLFLNTAAIALVIFAALPPPVSSLRLNALTLFDGNFRSYTASWHVLVGAGNIVLTMIINAVSPHGEMLWHLACLLPFRSETRGIAQTKQPPTLCCRRRTVTDFPTQGSLNAVFEPPEFEIPTRAAILMCVLVRAAECSAWRFR